MEHTTYTPDQEQIASTVRQYISEQFLYDKPNIELTNSSRLIELGIIDSLQIMQLISFLQEHLDYEVDHSELTLENFESIDAISGLISRSRS